MKRNILFTGLVFLLAACQASPQLSPADMTATVVALTPTVTNTPPAPTPTFTPTPEPIGLDEDLAAVIERAADGDTLYLAAGTYQLHEAIILEKALTLIGMGRDETKLAFDQGVVIDGTSPAVLQVFSPGSLTLKKVAVSYTGQDLASVIKVTDAKLDLSACRVDGVISSTDLMNSAIILKGAAGGRIDDCILAGDKFSAGVYVTGSGKTEITKSQIKGVRVGVTTGQNSNADFTLTDNEISLESDIGIGAYLLGASRVTFTKNSIDGGSHSIAFKDESSGMVSENRISNAKKAGFLIQSLGAITVEKNQISDCNNVGVAILEFAASTIKGNTIHSEQKSGEIGIEVIQDAGGEVLENTIDGYQLGILVDNDANPLIAGNILIDNRAGIGFAGYTTCTAARNKITNCPFGINVTEDAKPLLDENTIEIQVKENDSLPTYGILYSDNSGGVASKNIINGYREGISISRESAPELIENTISDAYYGLYYSAISGGKATGNKISNCDTGVDFSSMYVKSMTGPFFQGNQIFSNSFGINISGTSKPVIEDNEIYANGYSITVWDTSSPTIKENNIHDNEVDEIKYREVSR